MKLVGDLRVTNKLNRLKKFNCSIIISPDIIEGNLFGDNILHHHLNKFDLSGVGKYNRFIFLRKKSTNNMVLDISRFYHLHPIIFMGLAGNCPLPWTILTNNRHAISRAYGLWLDAGFIAFARSKCTRSALLTQWTNCCIWDGMSHKEQKEILKLIKKILW